MKKQLIIIGNDATAISLANMARQSGYGVFISSYQKIPATIKIEMVAHGIAFEEGQHNTARFTKADYIVTEDAQEAMWQNIAPNANVLCYTEAFLKVIHVPIVLIAGSQGKSSTAHALATLLQANNYRAVVTKANLADIATSFLEEAFDIVILSVSVEECTLLETIAPELILWLNHWEGEVPTQFVELLKAMGTTDRLIFNADDETIARTLNQTKIQGTAKPFSQSFFQKGEILITGNSFVNTEGNWQEPEMAVYPLAFKRGEHQVMNQIAAVLAARYFQVSDATIAHTLQSYTGMLNRMEYLPKVNGVSFVNDAAAYGREAAYQALEACMPSIVWITQGEVSLTDTPFADLVCRKVKAIITLSPSESLEKAFGELVYSMHEAENMEEAVHLAYYLTEKGDTVLYSPVIAANATPPIANYMGEQFRQAVFEQLKKMESLGFENDYSPERKYA